MNQLQIAIALEIIAIVAATWLLVKTRTELMGTWYRRAAYILVIAAWLALAATAVHAVIGDILLSRRRTCFVRPAS